MARSNPKSPRHGGGAAGPQADEKRTAPQSNEIDVPKSAKAPRKGRASKKIEVDVNALPHGLGVKPGLLKEGSSKADANEASAPTESTQSEQAQVDDQLMSEAASITATTNERTKLIEVQSSNEPRNEEVKVIATKDYTTSEAAQASEQPMEAVEKTSTTTPEPTGSVDLPTGEEKMEDVEEIASNTNELTESSAKAKGKKTAQPKAKLGISPYPDLERPTSEECYKVNELLSEAHGKVSAPENIPVPSRTVAGCGEVKFILEALVRTHLSAHTSMGNANRAIQGLLERYTIVQDGPCAGSVDWNEVRLAGAKELENAIRGGGMAPTKSKAIIKMLEMVHEENKTRREELKEKTAHVSTTQEAKKEIENVGVAEDPLAGDTKAAIMARFANETLLGSENILTLDYIHAMNPSEAFTKLTTYPGIGVKTAACVLLFCMQRPFFAVDTHVWRLCKWLGWVPEKADRNNTFWHCDVKVPDDLKYSLHQLMIAHGKSCGRCRANTSDSSEAWADGCAIDELVKRTGIRKGGEEEPKAKVKKRKAKTDEESEEEDEAEDKLPKPKTKSRKTNAKPAADKTNAKKSKAKSRSKKARSTSEDDDAEYEAPGAKSKSKATSKNSTSTPTTAAKGKRGKKAAANDVEGDVDGAESSPLKTKGRKGKAAAAVGNGAQQTSEKAESSPPKANSAAKRASKNPAPAANKAKKSRGKKAAAEESSQEKQVEEEAVPSIEGTD